jgi:hypothetical protein
MPETHLSFEEIRAAAHDLAQRRRDARADYEDWVEKAANAENAFRKKLAIELAKFRASEKGVGESEILANAEAADERRQRDIAHGMAKAALLRIEELEADRAMLRQLGDWSKDLETVG